VWQKVSGSQCGCVRVMVAYAMTTATCIDMRLRGEGGRGGTCKSTAGLLPLRLMKPPLLSLPPSCSQLTTEEANVTEHTHTHHSQSALLTKSLSPTPQGTFKTHGVTVP
jgi:hypothetical protein